MAVVSALKIPYLTVAMLICHIKEMNRLNMERAFAKGTEEMVAMGEVEVMEAEMEEVAKETEEMVAMGEMEVMEAEMQAMEVEMEEVATEMEEMAAIGGDGGG